VIRSIPPLDTLRSRELDVLAILMLYNYKYRALNEEIRWRLINDASTRREMQADINMSEDVFTNNLSLVRKAGLIDKETGRLSKSLQIIADKGFIISFNFNIIEDNEV
jgi:hypothetical protein